MTRKIMAAVWTALFLIGCVTTLHAGDKTFQSSKGEMVTILKQKKVRYRSFGTKKRSIVVVEDTGNGIEEKPIVIDESVNIPKVRTKIHFDYDSASLKRDSYSLLMEVGMALNDPQISGQKILISGHTDADGEEGYNRTLSVNRAEAVRDFLISACGVDGYRLKIRGYGEACPLSPNDTPGHKQENRRVEFEIAD